MYFGTQHAKIYLNTDLFGINCVTGMSCLFRKDVLEEAGGFVYLGKFLAEDYYLGKLFIDRYVLCVLRFDRDRSSGVVHHCLVLYVIACLHVEKRQLKI